MTLATARPRARDAAARRRTRARAAQHRRLLAAGAVEVAPGHYPAVVALHAAWLLGLWVFGRDATVQPAWLALFCVLQLLRAWVIATLGPRWTTRIIVAPGRPLVAAGPYRWMSHPNYAVVASEIAVLPLALGLPWFALALHRPQRRDARRPHPGRGAGARGRGRPAPLPGRP